MNAPADISSDTIAAIATPPGQGGVGIVRVSGPGVRAIASTLMGEVPAPRTAVYATINDAQGLQIDQGLVLFFPGPNSFTGEDVLELQGHGGTVVMTMLLERCLQLGARVAEPGEFSRRAFLNNKMDLAQAEAVADLIAASSQQAARAALQSLQGVFSDHIQALLKDLTELRVYIEGAIDFPEEEIDFLDKGDVQGRLQALIARVEETLAQSERGAVLREGMQIVLVGPPNAGKSSLLNYFTGQETAIVTDIPGTTRDVVAEQVMVNGVLFNMLDTAGLRDSDDVVESEGIRRAKKAMGLADIICVVLDASQSEAELNTLLSDYFASHSAEDKYYCVVLNKLDLVSKAPKLTAPAGVQLFPVSVIEEQGLWALSEFFVQAKQGQQEEQPAFLGRKRHIKVLEDTLGFLRAGSGQLQENGAGELVAEDLKQAQKALAQITGEFSSDDLLGEIFSTFCIGK